MPQNLSFNIEKNDTSAVEAKPTNFEVVELLKNEPRVQICEKSQILQVSAPIKDSKTLAGSFEASFTSDKDQCTIEESVINASNDPETRETESENISKLKKSKEVENLNKSSYENVGVSSISESKIFEDEKNDEFSKLKSKTFTVDASKKPRKFSLGFFKRLKKFFTKRHKTKTQMIKN